MSSREMLTVEEARNIAMNDGRAYCTVNFRDPSDENFEGIVKFEANPDGTWHVVELRNFNQSVSFVVWELDFSSYSGEDELVTEDDGHSVFSLYHVDVDFTGVYESLREYEEGENERDAIIENAETNKDVVSWLAATQEATDKVRESFWEATKEFNSKHIIMNYVTVGEIKRMTKYKSPEKN
jgi:hypothetical protein